MTEGPVGLSSCLWWSTAAATDATLTRSLALLTRSLAQIAKKVAKPSLQSIFISRRDVISIITSGTQNPMKIFIHMCV